MAGPGSQRAAPPSGRRHGWPPPPGGDRGPFSPSRWRSPIRGPWLTSVLGLVLLVGLPVEFLTGLLSYAAYDPRLGNDPNPGHGLFGLYLFDWFSTPSWLYRVNEGIHVMLGLVLVPVVLAKLWSVMPTLFDWPPWRSVAQLLERLSLVLVVGGIVFEMSTGLLDIDYFNQVSFYTAHFYGAWAFMAGFAVHVCVKLGDTVAALRGERLAAGLRTSLQETRSEPGPSRLVATRPSRPTISRRGVLALVAGTSASVFLVTAGETIGGPLRRLAVLGTHYRSPGSGANRFPVNRTAAEAALAPSATGAAWRLELAGARDVALGRGELLALPLTTATLPIACTEGWSTQQRWTGVRLLDLARLAGVDRPGTTTLEALDGHMVLLSGSQTAASDSMLALRVNGADLSPDHGYPARVVVPSAPGTHNLKWVRAIRFTGTV